MTTTSVTMRGCKQLSTPLLDSLPLSPAMQWFSISKISWKCQEPPLSCPMPTGTSVGMLSVEKILGYKGFHRLPLYIAWGPMCAWKGTACSLIQNPFLHRNNTSFCFFSLIWHVRTRKKHKILAPKQSGVLVNTIDIAKYLHKRRWGYGLKCSS